MQSSVDNYKKSVPISKIISTIELWRDKQLDGGELWGAIQKLECDLLEDPTGRELASLRNWRTANFWSRDSRPEAKEREAYFRSLAGKSWE